MFFLDGEVAKPLPFNENGEDGDVAWTDVIGKICL
jgi:hypothetical protein